MIMWLFVRQTHVALSADEKRVLTFGGIWFVSLYAITVFLPVRSDLYALTPSVGSALAVGAVGSAFHRTATNRFDTCCVALVMLPLLAIPIYRQRNERWVAPAKLSTEVMRSLKLATISYSSGQLILVDDPTARFGLDSSFGTLFGDAVRVTLGPAWGGEITRSPEKNVTGTGSQSVRLIFVLRNRRLVPARNDLTVKRR
jgi:hypothetical protein